MLGYRDAFRSLLLIAAIPLLLVAGSGPSSAYTTEFEWTDFSNFDGDVTYDRDGVVTLSDEGLGTDQISFTFETESMTGALDQVYWESNYGDFNGGSLSLVYVDIGTGVTWADFESSAGPLGGGDFDPAWTGTFLEIGDGGYGDAIGFDEMSTIIFGNFSSLGITIETLASYIATEMEGWRIAGHILDCNAEGSCTAIAAPIPAALWLFLSAVLGLVGIGRRRERMATA